MPDVTARVLPSATQLYRVGPAAGDHRQALRAGVSVLVPLLVLHRLGHLDWSAYAVFGSFAALYGRTSRHRERAAMQLAAGAALSASVVLGAVVALSPDRAWVSVPVGALVAVGGAALSERRAWHPPGPLFLLFGFAACATLPTRGVDVVVALVASVASALFSVAVGAAGSLGRGAPRLGAPTWSVVGRPALSRRHLTSYLLAPLVAGTAGTALHGSGTGHAYWAMVASVVPLTATDTAGRLTRAAHRLAGTLLGIALAAVLLALHTDGFATILIVVVLQIGAELLVGRNYALALVFVTPLALMMGELSHHLPPGQLLRDRTVETFLGVAVAVVVTLLDHDRAGAAPARRRSAEAD
jgi:hypothetical protein